MPRQPPAPRSDTRQTSSLPFRGGANLGLGCGNPQAIAALRAGETVLDLGSGGGFDCFLAARQVGPTGRVIGVDMTPQMVTKARANAREAGVTNVEFRLGEIEHLPVLDASVDVILSNCVINLSPSKAEVIEKRSGCCAPVVASPFRMSSLPRRSRSGFAGPRRR